MATSRIHTHTHTLTHIQHQEQLPRIIATDAGATTHEPRAQKVAESQCQSPIPYPEMCSSLETLLPTTRHWDCAFASDGSGTATSTRNCSFQHCAYRKRPQEASDEFMDTRMETEKGADSGADPSTLAEPAQQESPSKVVTSAMTSRAIWR